jgi:hypothetical protein
VKTGIDLNALSYLDNYSDSGTQQADFEKIYFAWLLGGGMEWRISETLTASAEPFFTRSLSPVVNGNGLFAAGLQAGIRLDFD